MLRHLTALCLALPCLFPAALLAQTGAGVLVVANGAAPDSVRIAEHYAAARHVPDNQVLRLTAPLTDEIDRATFERTIQAPIARWLAANSAHDRILYLVVTRGVPLRISGTAGRQGTTASVDSELTLLYRRLTGATVPVNGPVRNPYYAGDGDPAALRPFSRADYDIYLVTRLDGFSTEDALALVDRGVAPATGRAILLDAPSGMSDPRNAWLAQAAERLEALGSGHAIVHDTTSRVLQGHEEVIGYFSWGSNDPAVRGRAPAVEFAPGALAGMFLSSDARTFVEPPAEWTPGQTSLQASHAGTRQSLIGDFIRAGVTGVSGAVAEPFLDGAIRPDILLPAYLRGATLAEAFYMAMPYLGWQSIVAGDPLCAPFRAAAPGEEGAVPPVDPETELPVHFSGRRLAALARTMKTSEPALKRLLKAEARGARDDRAGTIDALREAVALDAGFLAAWRRLGLELEAAKRFDEAHDVYRKVIEMDRNDIIALNNLAYGLAVRDKQPEEALGLATRAAALARGSATVNDTLGWIHYLLGNTEDALRLIEPASRALPGNAEIQFHAAAVFSAVGRLDDAARALDAALKLDPAIGDRPDFQDVQRRLTREPPRRF